MVAGFKRFYLPAVKLNTAQGIVTNLNGQGIRFTWEISRDNTNKADTGTISIFNLSPTFRGALFEAWTALSKASGYLVEFGIGWEGVPETVIRGDVWRLVPEQRTPTDVETIISIGDGNKPLRDQAVGRSFAGTKIDIVLDYLVGLPPAPTDAGGGGLGLIYPPESKALVKTASAELPIQTWGNIPAGANTREAIDLIMDTLGLEWRVQNGAFIVMRGGVSNKPPPIIAPRSGLIRYAVRDDGGIELDALADPRVEPGVQILVQDDLGKSFGEPAYRVERVVFRGDTRGESVMTVSGAKALI